MPLIEACIDSLDSALAAAEAGAGRLELCARLDVGGTTPDAETIARVKERVRILVMVMIRPRAGDFVYTAAELEAMRREIDLARSLGAEGVVLGALTPEGDIDVAAMRALVAQARPLAVTFHRAFDLVRDPARSLESLVALGVERVLTSGGAPTAVEGIETLAALVAQAVGRLEIMAGGGVRGENAVRLVREAGVRELHLRGFATAGVREALLAAGLR